MYNWLYNFIAGIMIGTCMILPGVSGSVIAIMLGVYENVILLIGSGNSNYYKIKKLFPIALGAIIGIFIFGKVLLFFYNKYMYFMLYVFMGLMLGSIPILKREIALKKEKINFKILMLTFLLSLILFIIPKLFNFELNNLNFFNLFVGGFLYIIGKIIPGVSSSFFLMVLGLYNYFLEIITNPFNISINTIYYIIPFLLGMCLGFIIFIKIINYLLNNYFSKTYSGIIGFIMGSIVAIYPGIEFSIDFIISIILMMLSYAFVNELSKKSKKNDK